MDFLVDQMEQVLVVRLQDLRLQTAGTVHRPTVQCQHPFRWQTMLRGIETVEIGQQETGGIAHAPVGIGHALEDFVGDVHLAAIIGRRCPQPQHVGAQRIDYFLRRDHVAQRLRHLAALGVHGEAVGQQSLVGRDAAHRHRGQQRGLKPAAMLVGAFQVQFGGEMQFRAAFQHREVGGAGIEPDIQGIGDLVVLGGVRAQ